MAILQGNAKQGSTRGFYPRVINGSLRFNDDDGTYLSKSMNTVTGAWTLSMWIKRTGIGKSYDPLGSFRADEYRFENDALKIESGFTSSMLFRDPSAWYHLVFSDSGSNQTVYVNGTSIGTTGFSRDFGDSGTVFGRMAYNSTYFDGYLAEVHFTDGTAYTADDFGELKNGVWVAKTPDVTYGTNGFYLPFSDEGTIHTVSAGGNTAHSTTQNKIGGSSIAFDGSGDYLQVNANDLLKVGNRDFTWEAWVYASSVTTTQKLVAHGGSGAATNANGWGLTMLNTGVFQFDTESGGARINSSSHGMSANTWHHVAFVRDNGTVRFFVDGVAKGTGSNSDNVDSTANLYHGRIWDDASVQNFSGYMDEIRFSRSARYTSAFTAPTSAFTADANTIFLIHSDTTNGSTTFVDDSGVTSGLGNDLSGSENHWTTNNIDYTDQVLDSPTNNFATLNPLNTNSNLTLSDGNLQTTGGASWGGSKATMSIPKTGQWYWEVTLTAAGYNFITIASESAGLTNTGVDGTQGSKSYILLTYSPWDLRYNGTVVDNISMSAGDVIGIAVNDGVVSFYLNGVLQHTCTDTLNDSDEEYFPAAYSFVSDGLQMNFGQQPFKYDPPA